MCQGKTGKIPCLTYQVRPFQSFARPMGLSGPDAKNQG